MINIQNPFLKTFSTILARRLSDYAEENNLLPWFQFGFRRRRSTVSAASLLHEVAHSQLNNGKRTYACFVDFSKAFDKIDRTLLFQKLQRMSIPFKFCATLFQIFNETRIYIQSGQYLADSFCSNIGTPQGDSTAAILFSLFLSDIGQWIPDIGPLLNGVRVGLLMYADDIVLIAETAEDLQQKIDALHQYCRLNKLTVNITKTKCMIFHRGRCPQSSFTYDGQQLENVNSFDYLGFTFSVRLSFTRHLEKQITKARSRIGQLFAKLPIMKLPLQTSLELFRIYIVPIFLYGAPLYIGNCSTSALRSLDAVLTKFLKRYLFIPAWANNAMTYFITGTSPLSTFIQSRAPHLTKSFVYPECMSGLKLSFLQNSPEPSNFNIIENIPSSFWCSRSFSAIPSNPFYRKKLTQEIFDLRHKDMCKVKVFHKHYEATCICILCDTHAHPYHDRYCKITKCD